MKFIRLFSLIVVSFILASGCMKAEKVAYDTNSSSGLFLSFLAGALGGALPPTSNSYTGAQFVAVGDNGRAWWSDDGINWIATSYPYSGYSSASMKSVAFSGSKWVSVGNANGTCAAVWSSDDGKNWAQGGCLLTGSSSQMNAVAYGNGIFLAEGGFSAGSPSGNFVKSTDGVNWTTISTISIYQPSTSIVYEPTSSTFVVHFPSVSLYKTSDNGTTWVTFPAPGIATDKIFQGSNKSLIATGNDGNSSYPTAIYNFTTNSWITAGTILFTGSGFVKALKYGNGNYVAVGSPYNAGSSCAIRTTNIASASPWTTSTFSFNCTAVGIPFTAVNYNTKLGVFVSSGTESGNAITQFIYSSNGAYWTAGTAFTSSTSPVNAIGVAE